MANANPIDVKAAVKIAMKYLDDFRDIITARQVRLEETEYDDVGDWLITLSSVDDSSAPMGPLVAALGGARRDYRIFRIDAETGEVKSMKVRILQPVS
jgi:hypothetical protein